MSFKMSYSSLPLSFGAILQYSKYPLKSVMPMTAKIVKKRITIIISLKIAGIETNSALIETLRPSLRERILIGLKRRPILNTFRKPNYESSEPTASDVIEITTTMKSRIFQKAEQ